MHPDGIIIRALDVAYNQSTSGSESKVSVASARDGYVSSSVGVHIAPSLALWQS